MSRWQSLGLQPLLWCAGMNGPEAVYRGLCGPEMPFEGSDG